MHFWSIFRNPHFIWYWLIARTNSQAQNGVNFDFQVQFDLEDHGQSPHKTIGILIKVFYISDPILVILAWTVDELSHGQAHDWRTHTHTHTHAGNDNTWRPKLASGKKNLSTCWIVLKMIKDAFIISNISWILLNRRPNSQHSNTTYCISHTDNTMPTDALVT